MPCSFFLVQGVVCLLAIFFCGRAKFFDKLFILDRNLDVESFGKNPTQSTTVAKEYARLRALPGAIRPAALPMVLAGPGLP